MSSSDGNLSVTDRAPDLRTDWAVSLRTAAKVCSSMVHDSRSHCRMSRSQAPTWI